MTLGSSRRLLSGDIVFLNVVEFPPYIVKDGGFRRSLYGAEVNGFYHGVVLPIKAEIDLSCVGHSPCACRAS